MGVGCRKSGNDGVLGDLCIHYLGYIEPTSRRNTNAMGLGISKKLVMSIMLA